MALLFLTLFAGIQAAYWWYYFRKVSLYRNPGGTHTQKLPPVCIVICFKGLPEDVGNHLSAIADQQFPNKKIILVNDFSSENDVIYIQNFIEQSSCKDITLIHATQDLPGKKHAVLDGVLASTTDYILFTDIDCVPSGTLWVQKMMEKAVAEDVDVVLGYGPMKTPSTPIAWFSGFETVMTAMLYFGFHLAGETYMSVGRNWLVRKKSYLNALHHTKGQNLSSGDDDLLLQAMISQNSRITCCLDADTFIYSAPKTNLLSFLRQKSRHISTSVAYPLSISVKLFVFSFSLTGFYVFSVLFMALGWVGWMEVLIVVMGKWALQMMIHHRGFLKLKARLWLPLYPLGEIVLALYYPVLGIFKLFDKNRW
jgi:glycosyltransferase involved in cell wall biosynthesis